MFLHLPRGLPERQTRFLCLLAARPSLTRADYQRLLAVTECTAKRDLAELMSAGLVLRFGSTRNRRCGLNPRALLPPTVTDPDLSSKLTGSPGEDPAHIRIAIDPLSGQRHATRA